MKNDEEASMKNDEEASMKNDNASMKKMQSRRCPMQTVHVHQSHGKCPL